MKTQKGIVPARQKRGKGLATQAGPLPGPAKLPNADKRLGVLTKEMKAFTDGTLLEESWLDLMVRTLSAHRQYKQYDYYCSDLYGDIDAVVAKCLLKGKTPALESAMHGVLVEILDAAFECGVDIAGPKVQFRYFLEDQCKRLVEIADAEERKGNKSRKVKRGKDDIQPGKGREHGAKTPPAARALTTKP